MKRRDRTYDEDASRHDQRDTGANAASVFNPKGIGQNALLTAAAAIVPLLIVGVAGLTSLADRRKQKRSIRLPRR